jgi:hypothetical protein
LQPGFLSDGAEIKIYDRIWITEDLKISSLHDRKRNERLSLITGSGK